MFGRKRVVFLSAAVAATLLFAVTAEGQMQPRQQQEEGKQTTQQPSQQQGQQDPWSPQSSYNQKFNPEQLQRAQGTIESVDTFKPSPDAKTGVMLTVKTQDGQTQMVHLGPQEYVRQQGIEFSEGDRVILIGAPTQFEGREVMMAALVQTQDKVLQLRDSRGQPQWAEAAQSRQQQRMQGQGQQTGAFQPEPLDADMLIGTDVKGQGGQTLGQIKDVVLNPQRDKIDYVAIGSGGFLGIGTKYVAVPWGALTIQRASQDRIDSITLDISQDQWKQLEGFDTDNWPQSADPNWKQATAQQTGRQEGREEGTSPTGQSVPGTTQGEYGPDRAARREQDQQQAQAGMEQDLKYRRLTQLMGLPVKNMQQEDLGTLENVIIDMREGRPVFSTVQFGGFLGLGGRKATVPWASMDILPQMEVARVDVSQDVLRAVAYEEGNEPDLTQMSEVESIYQRFNQEPYWQTYGYMEGGQSGQDAQQQQQQEQQDMRKKQDQ
ncbi:MAG: PRC-barrel domain-containing protein [Planctomycetota bacterium]